MCQGPQEKGGDLTIREERGQDTWRGSGGEKKGGGLLVIMEVLAKPGSKVCTPNLMGQLAPREPGLFFLKRRRLEGRRQRFILRLVPQEEGNGNQKQADFTKTAASTRSAGEGTARGGKLARK